ncbi:MAG: DEAD/DEAH box helicase [Actinomycetota bacterium]
MAGQTPGQGGVGIDVTADSARSFELDRFQTEAIEAFDRGDSLLVAAPTGSGKTIVAEHGIEASLAAGAHTFYTSPIKALANQKFRDFRERYGHDNVGLLTGDVTVNGEAPVVVMTTEVLRNMLYERSARLRRLRCVVLDEVHYLQDRDRGPVWEEVLLNLPPDVRTISLSATVSNLEEFAEWLRSVRGPTTLVVETQRPVPLRHLLAVGDRQERATHVVPLLESGSLAEPARRFGRSERGSDRSRGSHDNRRSRGGGGRQQRGKGRHGGRSEGGRPPRRWVPPRRTRLVPRLLRDGLAPVIWFIFSRAGCDEAVDQCMSAGLDFTDDDDKDRLYGILRERTADIDDDTWFGLELDRWQDAFEAGITSHHAGLIPAVKEAVEVAFAEGLITVVFATETLALGVNLPARTVVLERLIKYDGEDHKPLTPMEFTQLTGRAGRRGLDDEGTAVACWNARIDVPAMATLAASTDYELRSAFAPNHNMVANLIRRSDRADARRFVARSFAQFQVDRSSVATETRTLDLERQLAAAERAIECDRGDVLAWHRERAASRRADDDDLGQLRPGAVIADRGGAIVLSVAHRRGGMSVRLATRSGEPVTVGAGELQAPVVELGVVDLPAGLGPTDPATVAWARDELQDHWPSTAHGVEGCPKLEVHLGAMGEADLLRGRIARKRAKDDRRAGRLVERFDRVAEILHETGFASGWELTDRGHLLTTLHGRSEIVLADVVADGALDHLDPPGFAAAISALIHESRRTDPESFRWPSPAVRHAIADLRRRADGYRRRELAALGEPLTGEPDPALVGVVYGWATGRPFEEVLPESMTGGDFVRAMRQVIDTCRQVAQTAAPTADVASEAILCLDHGVVRSRSELFRDLEDGELDDHENADDGDAEAKADEPASERTGSPW